MESESVREEAKREKKSITGTRGKGSTREKKSKRRRKGD